MKRWKKLVTVAGVAAGIATASVAAVSAGAAFTGQPTAVAPATAMCDHHTPGMDRMHDAMDGAMQRMHDAMAADTMATEMMGGMMGGAAPETETTPHDAHHDAAGDGKEVR
jgi:hypothetical protein